MKSKDILKVHENYAKEKKNTMFDAEKELESIEKVMQKDGRTEVDHLLYEAHLINTNSKGTDVMPEEKATAKRKIKRIYNKIKSIDPFMYNILQEEDKATVLIEESQDQE